MSRTFQRYAIYWTPEPESELAKFGTHWLDNPSGISDLPSDLVSRATKSPARYGLHATLKAPFRLRAGAGEADLQAALDRFCGMRRAPRGGNLKLSRFQGYLGLVLAAGKAEIDWLAAQCVTQFDHFRAPIDQSDRDRRSLGDYAGQQTIFLEEFGYPFILSTFEFHVTLAGPLNGEEIELVERVLAPHVAPFTEAPVKIDSLSLLGEPESGGAFQLISRHRFKN